MILTICGHRPDKLGGWTDNPLRKRVQDAIAWAYFELKPEKVLVGMALGTDQWAAALAVKRGIPFVAAVPCAEQEVKWNLDAQAKYFQLLKLAAEVVVVSKGTYGPGVMQKRNLWMLDRADAVLAVWDGKAGGGTDHCVKEALKRGLPVHRIVPETGERKLLS